MDMESHNRPEPDFEVRSETPHESSFSTPRFEINLKTLAIFLGLLGATVYTTWQFQGPWYSFGLLTILGSHEFGHYWACRKNNVDATLPHFIPVPGLIHIPVANIVMLTPGTLGAFIRIKEPIPNRRALMEIGASGPIAGFIVALPVLAAGLMNSQVTLESSAVAEPGLYFGSSLILWAVSGLVLGVDPTSPDVLVNLHPLAYAGWFGIFFTALNLLPMGQLDGGHVVYSLFRPRVGLWVARLCFAGLMIMGFWWPGWWVWCGLIFFIGMNHPPVLDETVLLEPKHRLTGYCSIALLAGAFIPVPFYIG